MNRQGLTVSINAAKSSIPLAAKTPISILTRQILQYAANIEQAYSIACQYSTFVSESILIGSAEENCAAIIEKSPEKTSLYRSPANTLHIICTNHYQSPEFADDCRNLENIAHSDSPARYSRIAELLAQKTPVDPADAADILRDTCGVGSTSIGLTSELALNQFIGHHSVIFLPHKRLIWVSTSPWQAGKYVAYDLNSIFGDSVDFSHEIYEPSLAIDADSMLQTHLYTNLVTYKRLAKTLRRAIDNNTTLPQDTLQCFLASNPNYYCTYSLLGDYALAHGKTDMALQYWQKAVAMPIPKKEERQSLRKKIYRCFNSCIKNKACSPDK
jgi:hypothetical protein